MEAHFFLGQFVWVHFETRLHKNINSPTYICFFICQLVEQLPNEIPLLLPQLESNGRAPEETAFLCCAIPNRLTRQLVSAPPPILKNCPRPLNRNCKTSRPALCSQQTFISQFCLILQNDRISSKHKTASIQKHGGGNWLDLHIIITLKKTNEDCIYCPVEFT